MSARDEGLEGGARAFLRRIPDSFEQATTQEFSGKLPNAKAARKELECYRKALASMGYCIKVLSADTEFPDCVFIEDTAVLLDERALITRPGAAARRGEVEAVRAELVHHYDVAEMHAPATMDGGDVLRLGRTLLVGESQRTNRDGIERLRAIAHPLGFDVVSLPVGFGALHLKCHASALDEKTLLVAENFLDPDLLPPHIRRVEIPRDEAYAANVIATQGKVLMAHGYPQTARILRGLGLRVTEVSMEEMKRADGSLTCLSLRG